MKMTGAEILLETLKEEGVETIFGYPGGMVIDIYHCMEKTDIEHILVRHEQGAVHAADGFARASGKVGVALVTSGPGATNTVTGIATAYMDSIPIVVISGQVPTHLIGNDAFQEVDIVGITRPCTKHNYLVKDVKDLAKTIKEAFHIARSGRPGPVLIDIPKNVSMEKAVYTPNMKINLKSYSPTYNPNLKQLKKVAALIKEAEKPVILAGGGVILSKATEELKRLAERAQIPVTNTLMGLGSFPGRDPLSLGMIGMHGTYRSNMSTKYCDLLIAVGVRFDDRVTGKTDVFASQAKVVHIDIDPTSIKKNVPVTIPVVGDCKLSLEHINTLLDADDLGDIKEKRKDWLEQIKFWRNTKPMAYDQGYGEKDYIKPQFVVESLADLVNGEAVITTEVGQNQMWTAQFYPFEKPGHFITSGGLGTMGFGLPAAIGAKAAVRDKDVFVIAGDGSIQMNIQEMITCLQSNLPVKVVILNNGYLGMVRQWQELFYDRCYAGTCMNFQPDFVKLAEAYGGVGFQCDRPENVVDTLKKGMASDKAVIMNFIVEPEECVYPMVPSGKPITEMLLA